MSVARKVQAVARANADQFIEELQALCRIPSKRTNPEAMLEAADYISAIITSYGGVARQIEWPDSHPYVLGEIAGGPNRLLNYNHYDIDIEPAGDPAKAKYPLYGAEIHDGNLYAKGVADDKGPLMARIHAAAAFKLAGVTAPTTAIFLLEGKDSLGSPGLASFVKAHAGELEADGCLWENSWLDEEGRLLLKLSEKGMLYVELSVKLMDRDMGSQTASILPNAAWELVDALSKLKLPDGTVAIPNFYDDLYVYPSSETRHLEGIVFEEGELLARSGLSQLTVPKADAAKSVRLEPTMTITGMASGDQSDGIALTLPGSARAKLEFRLVPWQDPNRLLDQLRSFLDDNGHSSVDIKTLGSLPPHRTSPDDPFVQLVAEAASAVYGVDPILEVATQLIGPQSAFAFTQMPIVGIGVGRAWASSDVDQSIAVDDYLDGVDLIIELMASMGKPKADLTGIRRESTR